MTIGCVSRSPHSTTIKFDTIAARRSSSSSTTPFADSKSSAISTIPTAPSTKVDRGLVNIKNFAIVDEKNVASILGTHPQSGQILSKGNNLKFRSAQVDFTHRVDRVQINNAVLTGDNLGGTGKGFIYTDSKQYDLTGTVIPMFGLNNAFGKLFGPLGGGPAGGLFGITFRVKGPLEKPDFQINPMSALAPGAFRSLFEYRAKEQPRVDGSEGN